MDLFNKAKDMADEHSDKLDDVKDRAGEVAGDLAEKTDTDKDDAIVDKVFGGDKE